MDKNLMAKRIAHMMARTHFAPGSGQMIEDTTGFNHSDHLYFRDLILTEESLPEVAFKLKKYGRQLQEANLWDADLEEAKRPEVKVDKKRRVRESSMVQVGVNVHVKFNGGQFREVLGLIKSLGGRVVDSRTWTWGIPAAQVLENKAKFEELGFVVPEITVDTNAAPVEAEKPTLKIVQVGKMLTFHMPFDRAMIDLFRTLKGFKYNDVDHTRTIALDRESEPKILQVLTLARQNNWIVDAPVEAELGKYEQSVAKLEASKKDFTTEIPELTALLKLTLRPYQLAGVNFLDMANGNAILADEMGLGKTPQGIAYVVWRKRKALVICPNSFKLGWVDEIEKFSHASSQVLGSKQAEFTQADFTIVNYENIHKHDFSKLNYDTLIIDESQNFKNRKAQRTIHVREVLAPKAKHVICLSGTAIINRTNEFYVQLHLVAPNLAGSWTKYTKAFCGGYDNGYGWVAKEATNLEGLFELIRPVYLRRTKAEVLPELPKKEHQDIKIEISKPIPKSSKKENALTLITGMKIAIARSKVKDTIDFVEQLVEDGGKVIVFSDYVDVATNIAAAFGEKAVLYVADLDLTERQAMKKRFQEDPNIRIFVATTKIAGVALTLTAANKVVFNDFPWTPGAMMQCEDRAHRFGQLLMVNVYRMVANHAFDRYLMNMLSNKMRILQAVLDGKFVPTEDRELAEQSIMMEMIGVLHGGIHGQISAAEVEARLGDLNAQTDTVRRAN